MTFWTRAARFYRDVLDSLSAGGSGGVLIDQSWASHRKLQELEARVASLESAQDARAAASLD